MNVSSRKAYRTLSVCILLHFACFSSASLANGMLTESSANDQKNDQKYVQSSTSASMTDEMRWTIKREVMSKPGVMLDMANMTDNGYVWTNDVVWVDSGTSATEQWYIAGFVFERPRYKDVWLQYAFTLSNLNGEIANFRRWYGDAIFR